MQQGVVVVAAAVVAVGRAVVVVIVIYMSTCTCTGTSTNDSCGHCILSLVGLIWLLLLLILMELLLGVGDTFALCEHALGALATPVTLAPLLCFCYFHYYRVLPRKKKKKKKRRAAISSAPLGVLGFFLLLAGNPIALLSLSLSLSTRSEGSTTLSWRILNPPLQ